MTRITLPKLRGVATPGHGAVWVPWWLLLVPVVLIWFYLFVGAWGDAGLVDVANLLGPSAVGLSALATVYRMVRRRREAVWTPFAWFLVGAALFYSAGPLIYPLAGPRTLVYAMSFLPVGPQALLRTNLLNAVGMLSLLAGVIVGHRVWAQLRRSRVSTDGAQPSSALDARKVALGFLVIGGLLEYTVILPYELGLSDIVLPGVVKNLGDLYLLGLMVLAYVAARGSRMWQWMLVALWILQVVVSLLMFSKHQLLLSLILPPLGAFLAHGQVKRLAAFGGIAVVAYLSAGNFVLWSRGQLAQQVGTMARPTLAVRMHVARNWFDHGMHESTQGARAAGTGWNRLNYAPEQALAMQRYDSGYTGDTLRYAAIVFIPRVFWPEKPVTSDLGADFNESVTGSRDSQLGLGIFGEGYWDFGWPGVVGLAFLTGLVFAWLSIASAGWMLRRAFEYMPCVLLGVNMGVVGTTQNFVNSVMGATGFIVVYAVMIWALVRMLRGRRAALVGSAARRL